MFRASLYLLSLLLLSTTYSQNEITLKCKGIGKNDSKYLSVSLISSVKDIEKLKQSIKIKVINELFFVGVSKNEVCRNGNKPIANQFNFNYKDLEDHLSTIINIEPFISFQPNYPVGTRKLKKRNVLYDFNILVDLKNLRRELFNRNLITTKL